MILRTAVIFMMIIGCGLDEAQAVELQKPCEDVRGFSCTFSYALEGRKYSGTAEMLDYKYLFADSYCDVYQSKLTLSTAGQVLVYATEDDNNGNDIEESRDSEPGSRNGWGGKEFYLPLSGDIALMTSARRLQIGEKSRSYDLVLLKAMDGEDPQPVGTGEMVCEQVTLQN